MYSINGCAFYTSESMQLRFPSLLRAHVYASIRGMHTFIITSFVIVLDTNHPDEGVTNYECWEDYSLPPF